jgi:hypothetical protein
MIKPIMDPALRELLRDVKKASKYPNHTLPLDGASLWPPLKSCIITWEDLTDGCSFYQCSQCQDGCVSVLSMERLLQYALHVHQALQCPNCRQDWVARPPLLYRSPLNTLMEEPDIIFVSAIPASAQYLTEHPPLPPAIHQHTIPTETATPINTGPLRRRRRLPLWWYKFLAPTHV